MTQPTTDEDDEVDGSDEDDHDAMETAIGAALTALLIAELLPGPSSFFPQTQASWGARVEAAVGQTIRGFIARSSLDLASASGQPSASAAASEAADEAYAQVMSDVEEWSYETWQHLTDRQLPEDQVASAAQNAGEQLARTVAAYSKGTARESTASKLGAIWKIWRTRNDDRVRESHAELNNTKVAHGGRWHTDEGYIRFPGDPEAAISLVAGCRCHLNYRFRPKEMDYADV